jgi:hypothetical protein
LELLFHLTGEEFLSTFVVLSAVKAFKTGVDWHETPKACAMISLSTTMFDSQNVNLHQSLILKSKSKGANIYGHI